MSILKIIDHTNLHDLWLEIKAAFWAKEDVVSIGLDNTPTASSENLVKSGGVKAALDAKQDTLTFDNAATKNSTNAIKSGAVYDAAHPAVVNHGTSDTTFALTPNVLHTWGTVSALTLTLATPADGSIENEYKFRFQSGSTPTTLGLPNTVIFDDKKGDLIPEANHIYEVSIVDNSAVWAGWEVSNE